MVVELITFTPPCSHNASMEPRRFRFDLMPGNVQNAAPVTVLPQVIASGCHTLPSASSVTNQVAARSNGSIVFDFASCKSWRPSAYAVGMPKQTTESG